MKKKFLFVLFFLTIQVLNLQSEETRKFSLNDCVKLAIKNNLDIKIEKFNPSAAEKNLEIEKSYFDKNLLLNINTKKTKNISSSEEAGLSFSLLQKLYSGANLSVRLNTQKQKVFTPFKDLNYYSDISISLIYPLMEGKGEETNTAGIKTAQIEFDISELKLKQKIIEIINIVEISYYNLMFAKENMKIREKEKNSALEFEKEIDEKINTGVLPKSDILSAQAKTAQSEARFISAKGEFQKALNNLLKLIYPYDEIKNIDVYDLDELDEKGIYIEKEKKYALANRPDYLILKKNLEKQEMALKLAKNRLLPDVNLISDVEFSGKEKNYETAFKNILDEGKYSYQISIQMKCPLGNREARERYTLEKIRKEQLLVLIRNLELKIEKEIQDALEDVKIAKERMNAESRATLLSYQNLQQEKEKFRLGLSTVFNVLRCEDEYGSAKMNELRSKIDYKIALSNLNKITGRNFSKYLGQEEK